MTGAALHPEHPVAKAGGRRRIWRKLLLLVLALVAVAAVLPLAGLFFSESFLMVERAAAPADAMVVLGGEPTQRPPRAIELYREKAAPIVLVSGKGDCDDVRRLLEQGGVPARAIQMESNSISTRQNAQFCVPLLRRLHAQRVIIVTSWFHSRRALDCFRHYAPDIDFISMPTVADRPHFHWPGRYERAYVLNEYVKLLGYWIVYGVRPF